MSAFNDFCEKVRELPPLKRRFTSAAIGVGTAAVSAGLGFWPGLIGAVGSGFVIDKYSHTADDPNNYQGVKLNSGDYWKNIGSWGAAYLVAVNLMGGVAGGAEPENEPEVIGPQGSLLEETAEDRPVQLADAGNAQPVVDYYKPM